MPIYETVFIARQDLSAKQVEDLTEKMSAFITADGGKILKTENWGLRTLAYRIKKNRKGHYILLETDTPPAALIEMERNLRLNEDVLRYLTVRREEPSKGQSAILDKSSDRRYEEGDRNPQEEAA